jgi:hypothetical protein
VDELDAGGVDPDVVGGPPAMCHLKSSLTW